MNYKPSTILFVQGALIAASYVALTIVFAPLSFMEIQVRISESLTILPVFTAAAVPGLTIGCFLANILGGAPLPDVIFGLLATLVGAVGTVTSGQEACSGSPSSYYLKHAGYPICASLCVWRSFANPTADGSYRHRRNDIVWCFGITAV